MSNKELHDFLTSQGYSYDRESEYNRDVFTKNVTVNDQNTKVEVLADYYTVRIIWWYSPHKKVSTSTHIKDIDEGILQLLIKGLIDNNTLAC